MTISSLSKAINLGALAQLKTLAKSTQPYQRFTDVENIRGRITCRIVRIFTDLRGIDFDWVGLQNLICVERIGVRQGKPYHQTNYYISSLSTSAFEFAQAIRSHWRIENCLHWVKDVIFSEDAAPFKNYNAATTGVDYPQYRHQSCSALWL